MEIAEEELRWSRDDTEAACAEAEALLQAAAAKAKAIGSAQETGFFLRDLI